MLKEGKKLQFLSYIAFLAGLLLVPGACGSSPPEVSIVIPPAPEMELGPGESAPLEADVTPEESIRVEWTAECLNASNDECQKVLKDKEGTTNFITAPDRPGEQIIVSVVAVDSQGRTSEKDTTTVTVVTRTDGASPIPEGAITISSPKEGEEVTCQATVTGTKPANLPSDQFVWLIIQPRGISSFYPQPGLVVIDDAWQANVQIGLCPEGDPEGRDVGRSFDLFIGIADAEADQTFQQYLEKASKEKSWPGIPTLPAGYNLQTKVTVIRK